MSNVAHKEHLYCVKYVEALERDRKEITKATQLLNEAGVATGNEHLAYSLSERIDWLIKVRDYQRRKIDNSPAMLQRVNDEIRKTDGTGPTSCLDCNGRGWFKQTNHIAVCESCMGTGRQRQ